MKCARVWTILFGSLLLLVAFTGLTFADELATLTGYLTDPRGLRVPDAKIQVTNIETNVSYASRTNEEGLYRIPSIPSGTYRMVVQKSGFKTIVKQGVELHIQDVIALNFQLEVGSLAETVTVEEGAPMINTTNAAVSTVVDQTYVKNMPLNGRSFQDLILLTPGTVTQTPQFSTLNGNSGLGRTGEFSVNGQRTESNYYTVDGVSANVGGGPGFAMTDGAGASGSLAASTALGTTQALVSVDALKEFRVQSSSYSAEYGRNPGGQFAFETKSGANQWHGTAYDYLRNDLFDANDWFNNYFQKPEPPLRQNDFGGTLGGPVRIPGLYNGKDKTFFFVSYEGLRLTSPQPASVSIVPDATLRANTPSPLNQALNAFPVPNGPEVLVKCDPATDPACPLAGQKQDGLARFIGSWSNPSSVNSTSTRVDHAVNDKLRLFFRYSDANSSSSSRETSAIGGVPSVLDTSPYLLRTYTAGFSGVFYSHLSNEFRVNYSSNEATSRAAIDSFGGNTSINLLQVSGLGAGSHAQLTFLYDGQFFYLHQGQTSGVQRQWNLVDAVSLSVGRHQFKFGVDYRRLTPVAVLYNSSRNYAFRSESAVLANSAFGIAAAYGSAYPLYTNFSAFAQDEWRVSQRFSLSLGLRWEVSPPPGVTKGLQAYTVQGSGPDNWTLAPQGTRLWQTTWYNFAPRLGAAYILQNASGRETVVRGGGGVFFDTGQQLGSQGFDGGPGFFALAFSRGVSFPSSLTSAVIANPPVAGTYEPFAFAPHLQLPYTLQWNASIEQALGKSQALTLSYVGSHASRLLEQNQFSSPTNPNASFFIFTENGLTADYNSLQVQFRRRLSRGLTGLASYTWSHCLDYGSSNLLVGYQRGNCDFDIRDNLSAAFSYDLPSVGHNAFVNAVLHHWGLDDRFTARSAFPITLVGNDLLQPDGRIFHAQLDLVSGQPIYLYGSNCASVLQGLGDLTPGQGCPGGRAVNPNAFAQVPTDPSTGNALRQGTAKRNFARGFGAWQMDLAIRRDFPIHERLKLQFRAEAFNIFNHPNFGTIDPNFGSPTFGQATATLASSLGVLSPLYQQGGPRSMQFALKIIF